MCILILVCPKDLKTGFQKNEPEPYHTVGNDENIFSEILYENNVLFLSFD